MAYLAGTLPEETAQAVNSHVDACAACRGTIQTLGDADDTGKDPAAGPPGLREGELPSMSASDASPRQLGEYKLLEKLGEGGMGAVYKAIQTELDRVVALKVLSKGRVADDLAVARFKREMKAVGRLDHPNIVRAYDARQINGTPVLVMEYVDGFDLAELVRRLGPLPIADACELVRQTAVGLQYAHENGLVHRDVKPSNLVLGADGQVRILDLGLARIHLPDTSGDEMTSTGDAMGTPEYMAPEQVSDSHSVDIRADVYSLGCTLYKLLAGRAPFSGPEYQSAFDKMAAHVHEPPPPIGQFRSDVPDDVTAILDRMLAKDPDERFSSPREIVDALSPVALPADLPALLTRAGGSPRAPRATAVSAPLPSAGQPSFWQRNASKIAMASMLLAVGALAAFGIIFGVGRDRHEPIAGGDKTSSDRDRGVSQGDTQASASATLDEFGPLPGWVVLSWAPPGGGKTDLWLFRPDGEERVQITDGAGSFDVHPALSPDGRQVAFIRGEQGLESMGVWIANVDGSDARQLVAGERPSERLVSPVWISDSRIAYARDPRLDRLPDMEVWEVDVAEGEPRRMFRFEEALSEGGGLVTDASPDGRQLLVVAQHPGMWPTADVYLTDLEGTPVCTLWADHPDSRKDARALWSPDGKSIAWHHNFTAGAFVQPIHYGVGLARLGADGQWAVKTQPDESTFITPLAWSPDGRHLLCVRMEEGRSPATVFLMDHEFRTAGELFEIEAQCWQSSQRDFGRLADWGVIPDDVVLPRAD